LSALDKTSQASFGGDLGALFDHPPLVNKLDHSHNPNRPLRGIEPELKQQIDIFLDALGQFLDLLLSIRNLPPGNRVRLLSLFPLPPPSSSLTRLSYFYPAHPTVHPLSFVIWHTPQFIDNYVIGTLKLMPVSTNQGLGKSAFKHLIAQAFLFYPLKVEALFFWLGCDDDDDDEGKLITCKESISILSPEQLEG
jgi:hypothetical protein